MKLILQSWVVFIVLVLLLFAAPGPNAFDSNTIGNWSAAATWTFNVWTFYSAIILIFTTATSTVVFLIKRRGCYDNFFSSVLMLKSMQRCSAKQIRVGQSKLETAFKPSLLTRVFLFSILLVSVFTIQAQAQNYRASASAGVTTGVLTLTINKPTGTVNPDVMIAAITVRPNTATITAPAGWTLIRRTNQTLGNTSSQATYWKAAGASEPASYAWTFSTSTGAAGGISTFYNINTLNPINVESGQTTPSSLSHATPSVTTTEANTMVITTYSIASSATWTAPTGMTETIDRASDAVPAATGISIEMNYVTQAAAGATGTKTATASNDADYGITQVMALESSYIWTGAVSTNWATAGNWSNGVVPTSAVDATIPSTATQPTISSSVSCNDLIINSGATLTTSSAGALNITGNITNNGTMTNSGITNFSGTTTQQTFSGVTTFNSLTLNNTAGLLLGGIITVNGNLTITTGTLNTNSNNITLSGNLTNNGGFTAGTGRVTFTGSASNTVTGTSTTAFNTITVNKGTNSNSIIDVQSVITMASGGLTLTNGTFELSSASTITPFTADISASPYLIPSTAGLWCNGGTISASTMDWTIAGLLKVTGGTLTVGSAADDVLIPRSTASIVVDGGNLNLASRISNTTVAWTFSMTAGIMTINTAGSIAASRPAFNMDAVGCSFSMSGGTMVIQRSAGSAGQNLGFNNLGISGTGFTGGTLQIGNGSTPAASTIGITSTNAIYNLTVNAASSTGQLQTSALTVVNALTISAGTLSANNFNLTVGGGWTNNVATSAFTAGTATVTLNGTAAQSIAGSFATTFNNLTVSNTANVVTSAVNASVSGNLSVSSGTFNLGAFTADRASAGGTLTISNGATLKIGGTNTVPANYSTHSVGTTSTIEYSGSNQSVTVLNSAQDYGHLTISGSGTKTLAGSVNVGGTLTFTAATITTGASTLYLKSTGTVSRTSGHVIGNFKKNVATGATSKTFELGDATSYTPVDVAFASVTTAGDLTASVVSGDHANIGTSTINASKSVNRNWTLTNSGIVFTNYGATFTFVAGDLDAGATTSAFIVGKYSVGWTYPTVGTKTSTTTQTTGLTTFGDFQLGEVTVVTKTWDGGAATNNWGDAANWNADGVPISTSNVDLTGANTININVAAVANNLLLNNASLVLTINSGQSLAVSGNLTLTSGTLNTAAAFPTVTGTVNVAAGTVGFTGSGAQTIPAYNYNNLTSSSTGGRTLASSGTIGVAGTFTPGTNTYTTTGSTIDVNSGSTQTIPAFNYNNLTLSNAGTKAFSSGTTGVAGTLAIAGAATADATTSSSTISYRGSTNQAVTALTYYNLDVSSSAGVVTLLTTTVNNNFAVTTGIASIGNSITAQAVTVVGSITISSGATFNVNSSFAATHTLTVGGDFTNGGTLDLRPNATSLCNTTFNKNGNQTVSGAGATTSFNRITLNMGATYNNTMEVTATNFSAPTPFLTLTNGTFKLSSNSTITPFTADITTAPYLIPSTAGLWVNGGTVSTTSDVTPAGLIRVSNGTFNLGNAADHRLLSSWATIIIEGGIFNISGRLVRRVTGEGHYFTMSGGTLTVGTMGSTNTTYGPFTMDAAGSSFTMSGGTIVIRREGGTGTQDLGYTNLAGTSNVTGGTLQIGDASTPAAQTMQINSTVPIWNLTVNATSTPIAKLLTSPLTVKGDVTISGGTLDANNLNLTAAGNWTNNSSTVAFTSGTATVTLNGTAAQSIAGSFATTFNNLTISNTANTVTSAVNASVSGNLSVSSGTFNLGTFTANRASAGGTLTVSNGATLKIGGTNTLPANYSTHAIGATSTIEYSGTNQSLAALNSAQDYGHLTISGSGTKTLAGSVNVGGTLTFTAATITTGASTLYLKSTGTVSRTSGHVIGNFKKNVATGATSKTFEVGDATSYTPVDVAFASVTTAGDLTASVVSGDHANIGTSTINASKTANRNWTLTNSGIVFTNYGATFTFVAGDLDAGATTSAFIVGKYSVGWTYPTVGTKTSTTTQATGLTAFGDFQLGEASLLPPNVPLVKSVVPSSPQSPGTDLVYTVVFTNDGGLPAQVFVVIDPLPANTDFKLASASTSLGTTGMTVVIAYSNNNGVSYIYTPVSAAGGAPAGYDRTVTHIRWTFTGNLSQTSPNNTGSISFAVRVR